MTSHPMYEDAIRRNRESAKDAEIERLRAEVAEVRAESVRIERENIEGWKQATHCRGRLTATESELAALRKRVEGAPVGTVFRMNFFGREKPAVYVIAPDDFAADSARLVVDD